MVQGIALVPADGNNMTDIEAQIPPEHHLTNTLIHNIAWDDINVVVKSRKTQQPVSILSSSYGYVAAGRVLALMGPSGSGKSTLLNVLAHRAATSQARVRGNVMLNGRQVGKGHIRQLSSYVEQEDALIGSLTVRETISFSAKLALGSSVSSSECQRRADALIESFGLRNQTDTIVGTPLQKGISGGQKRRLSIATQLVTSPKLLFLDEPTSGLDSAASREVMSYISDLAKKHRIIVIVSIHQPSSAVFTFFDHLLLLSAGRTCFFGCTQEALTYFERIGFSVPINTNPAEYMLDLVNADFTKDSSSADERMATIHTAWSSSWENKQVVQLIDSQMADLTKYSLSKIDSASILYATLILLHRNFVKSYRDLLAYGTRVIMYLCLAIMMGTVWLRLSYDQSSIQPFINAIFFGGAFMSFMAVAYVPSIIEDLLMFKKEHANGLYGPLSFTVANFFIGIPYLFIIAVLFSVVSYWLVNFRSSATGFWMYTLWLFLDLLAAEGLVVLVTSIAPIFVVSLAVTAFANGLWMCVGGFLVPLGTLNVFYKCKLIYRKSITIANARHRRFPLYRLPGICLSRHDGESV